MLGTLMAALARHLEGNIVGGVAFDLEGGLGDMVEILVEELLRTKTLALALRSQSNR